MRHVELAALAAILFLAAPQDSKKAPATPDALATGTELARGEFAGFTWGEKREKKQVDCTTFLLRVCTVMAERCGTKLSEQTRRRLLVDDLTRDERKQLDDLVEKGDPKIQGVASALVAAGLGTAIEPKDARPGDLVQYWYLSKKNSKVDRSNRPTESTWAGHAGMIESVDAKTQVATIFGSHKTTLTARADGKTDVDVTLGGIGSGPKISLTDGKYRIYVVRWTTATK